MSIFLMVLGALFLSAAVAALAVSGTGSDQKRTSPPYADRPFPPQRSQGSGSASCRPAGGSRSCGTKGERRKNSYRPLMQSSAPAPAPERCRLDASKAVGALELVLRNYGRPLPWSGRHSRDDFVHDLALMRQQDDLNRVDIDLIDRAGAVVYRQRIAFDQARGGAVRDLAGGHELPVLPHGTVVNHRLIVSRKGREATYRNRLRLSWGTAEKLAEQCTEQFASGHTARINGGKARGEVAVSTAARRTAAIHKVCDSGTYAFARIAGFPGDIYLHADCRDGSFALRPGLRVSFVVVQTPLGLQGRSIRCA